MPSHYTSFRVKNTTTDPLIISVTDPDGIIHKVGTIDPGKESLQLAPFGSMWSIELSNPTPVDNVDSPTQSRQTSIAPSYSKIETRNEPNSLMSWSSAESQPHNIRLAATIRT